MNQSDVILRKHYIHQLDDLRDALLRMGGLVEHGMKGALRSLEILNITIAAQVIADDSHIDDAKQSLEEEVLVLITTQQPLAEDLRLVTSVFAIASELERIGDYATGIARRVRHMSSLSALITAPAGLDEMSSLAMKMVHTCLDAFLRQDTSLSYSLVQDEERIDNLARQLRAELIQQAQTDPLRIEAIIDMISVVHFLERTADRCTNIGERIIFVETSLTEKLNPD